MSLSAELTKTSKKTAEGYPMPVPCKVTTHSELVYAAFKIIAE